MSEFGKTGAFISLSCYYHDSASNPGSRLENAFVLGFSWPAWVAINSAHIVATHPALSGVTNASLSNWSCSVHEAFHAWPITFQVLAIAQGIGTLIYGFRRFGGNSLCSRQRR